VEDGVGLGGVQGLGGGFAAVGDGGDDVVVVDAGVAGLYGDRLRSAGDDFGWFARIGGPLGASWPLMGRRGWLVRGFGRGALRGRIWGGRTGRRRAGLGA